MQLEKTDGGTHSDDITGNDADAGKIRRRKTTDSPLPLRDYFDSGTCPAMPMRGGAGKRSGAPTRRAS